MIRSILATAAGGAILAACASGEAEAPLPPYEPPATLAEATEGSSEVALYEAGDEDTTVYMMGTIHILRTGVDWKTSAYEAAFAEADAVYLEADTSPEVAAALQPVVLELGLNPQGTVFADYFEEAEREDLAAALSAFGMPIENLAPMRPWLASVTLGVVGIQKLGGDPEAGVEKMIEADAAAVGKEMRTLETAEQQLRILAGVPDEAWADALVADLDQFADIEGYFAHMVGAWYDGRMDALDDVMNEGLAENPQVADAVLYTRNEDWADQLAELIETEEGTYLVAVGAAHLTGERSVQDYLAQRGYEASRVAE